MLQSLGRTMARRRIWVVAVWACVFAAVGVLAAVHHGSEVNIFSIPGASSQKATNLLETAFPAASGTSAQIVFQAQSGSLRDATNSAAVDASAALLSAIPGAGKVSNPLTPTVTGITGQGPTFGTPQVNARGDVAYTTVQFSSTPTNSDDWVALYHRMQDAAKPATDAGIKVMISGQVADIANPPPAGISQYSEEIGILMAVIILLVALRSALAMMIPIVVGVVAVLLSANIVSILASAFTVNSVAPVLGSMIGLGVGIDYTLFIVSRYRQELDAGVASDAAIGVALQTSGSAVIFAGVTVCVALCGLALIGIPYVTEMGVIASLYVVVTMLTALTLGPAIVALCGRRLNSGRLYRRHLEKADKPTLSSRWAAATARRPAIYAAIAVVILLALASPLLSIQLGFADDGNLPASSPQRQAFDLLAEDFGPGINSPLIVAAELPPITPQTSASLLTGIGNLISQMRATPGVSSVSLPLPNRSLPFVLKPGAAAGSTNPADYAYDFTTALQPTALIIEVTPSTAPNAQSTSDLVTTLRNSVIPGALAQSDLPPSQVYVGGSTATQIDLADAITSKLIWFIAAVVLLAMLLLMAVFRSLVIPLSAAIMNVLSIGAAYGVIVLVFQHGVGSGLIGLPNAVPVVAFVPVMMFAILFGLSMDYEVFLLTRIREEYERDGDPTACVTVGVTQTARVISAAALIMISVFLSFVPNPDATVKMIGFGMAASVLFDASIVRMMLVPSTMELSGRANWWFPRFLDRVIPKIPVA